MPDQQPQHFTCFFTELFRCQRYFVVDGNILRTVIAEQFVIRILLDPPGRCKHTDLNHNEGIVIGSQHIVDHFIEGIIINGAVFQPDGITAALIQVAAVGNVQIQPGFIDTGLGIGLQINIQVRPQIEVGSGWLTVDHQRRRTIINLHRGDHILSAGVGCNSLEIQKLVLIDIVAGQKQHIFIHLQGVLTGFKVIRNRHPALYLKGFAYRPIQRLFVGYKGQRNGGDLADGVTAIYRYGRCKVGFDGTIQPQLDSKFQISASRHRIRHRSAEHLCHIIDVEGVVIEYGTPRRAGRLTVFFTADPTGIVIVHRDPIHRRFIYSFGGTNGIIGCHDRSTLILQRKLTVKQHRRLRNQVVALQGNHILALLNLVGQIIRCHIGPGVLTHIPVFVDKLAIEIESILIIDCQLEGSILCFLVQIEGVAEETVLLHRFIYRIFRVPDPEAVPVRTLGGFGNHINGYILEGDRAGLVRT